MMVNLKLSYKGKTLNLEFPKDITINELVHHARIELNLDEDCYRVKLLHKGKILNNNPEKNDEAVFPTIKSPSNIPVITVLATNESQVSEVTTRKSDPLTRGFDNQKIVPKSQPLFWGQDHTSQDKNYKFVKFEVCTWQSFGHRTGSKTPHDFEAMRLLEKLSTDPGIKKIMINRELVVNYLGEMDPLDDRIMQSVEAKGGCLLGYNTNHGLRIDLKLRSDDLQSFRPYEELVSTLIHELSHNWVSEHDILFWTNYGQMRVDYLHHHALLSSNGYLFNGKTTAELAGINSYIQDGMKSIYSNIMLELQKEMVQHGLSANMIAPAIQFHCNELSLDLKLGQSLNVSNSSNTNYKRQDKRQLALEAAERRRTEKSEKDETKQ